MIQQRQILIVEDNELSRYMMREILSDEYRILEAENGKKALDILVNHRDDINLILLDLRMPVMDGYSFLDKMREDSELALIPIIVMTADAFAEDVPKAADAGMDGHVSKPVDFEQLYEILRELLQ